MQLKRLARALCVVALAVPGMVKPSPASAEVQIFACEPEWAALASEIGGDVAHVYSATHGRQDPHYIRARPSLIAQVRQADVLFCSGAGLEEGWLPVLLQRGARVTIQRDQPGHLMASEHVRMLDPPSLVDRSQGHVHAEGNPHVQLLPENIAFLATELARRLTVIDPDNAEVYRRQLSVFQERWKDATANWMERTSHLEGMPVVVHHEAWAYLFELDRHQASCVDRTPTRCPSDRQPSAIGVGTGPKCRCRRHSPCSVRAFRGDGVAFRQGRIPIVDLPFTVGGQEGVDDLFDLFEVTITLLEEVRDQY